MNEETETLRPESERTPVAYRRDLYRARLVIGQFRDEALASGEPFQVAGLALDAPPWMRFGTGSIGLTRASGKRSPTAATWTPGRKSRRQASSAPGGNSGRRDSRLGCPWWPLTGPICRIIASEVNGAIRPTNAPVLAILAGRPGVSRRRGVEVSGV